MKIFILIFTAFLFCGCYSQVITTDIPRQDYIGVTVIHPLWHWNGFGHRYYRSHRIFIEPRKLKPIPSTTHRDSGNRK